MRRQTVLLGLFALLGCADPGLRDRSLMRSLENGATAALVTPRANTKKAPTSVIGLVADDLAQYYVEDAELVVRFAPLARLREQPAVQLANVGKTLPQLGLPKGRPDDLLRRVLRLPKEVVLDPVRPLALVKTKRGWAGIVPTRSHAVGKGRLKQLDALYCVAGDPKLVEAYEPGFRKGFYLPGDCSVLVKPAALPQLGTSLTAAAARLGMDLRSLDGFKAPRDIERIDLACHFGSDGLRVEVRAAPDPASPTAVILEGMRPQTSAAARWLPDGGTAYMEVVVPPLDCEGLALNLLRDRLTHEPEEERVLLAVRGFLAALGRDAAAMLKLAPDGSGTVRLVAHLEDRKAAEAFFKGSFEFEQLMALVAGAEGRLGYKPLSFVRDDVRVAAITGSISRPRLLRWRKSGNVFLSALGVLLHGPVVAYVAILEDKLCIVAGKGARSEMEGFLDHLRSDTPSGNEHNAEVAALFNQRIATVSVDLAALFDGSRDAAPYWHRRGAELRELELRWRLPAAVAVTVEGGALRAAVRVSPTALAKAAAQILATIK